jgi:hypothetical protein
MGIESDAEGDLGLDTDDAENVAGGKTANKISKTKLPTAPVGGSHPEEASTPERSLEGLESH